MSVTDYVIDILLILVIFRQVRPHELTPRAALLPLALLAAAGIIYLRPFTLRGNDLALILILPPPVSCSARSAAWPTGSGGTSRVG